MSEQSETRSHKRGRTTFEVPERKWPVVTRTMLKHTADFGAPSEEENPLVTSLLRGYVLNANVEIHLKRALQEAVKKRELHTRSGNEPDVKEASADWMEAQKLVLKLEIEILRVQQVKEEWPLEIVG